MGEEDFDPYTIRDLYNWVEDLHQAVFPAGARCGELRSKDASMEVPSHKNRGEGQRFCARSKAATPACVREAKKHMSKRSRGCWPFGVAFPRMGHGV